MQATKTQVVMPEELQKRCQDVAARLTIKTGVRHTVSSICRELIEKGLPGLEKKAEKHE